MAQTVGAALVIGADDTSHYEMTRDESFVMSEQRRRAFMRAVPSYSSSTLNTVASESYCIPEDVLHAAGGTSTPEKKLNQPRQPSGSPVPFNTHHQTTTTTHAQQRAAPTTQHNKSLQNSSSTSTLRDSDLDRFEDAEEDGDVSLDSPDTSAEVCVATVARLAPPSTGTRGIFHKNAGIGHGLGHRPQQPTVAPRPQTHDPRAKVKPNNNSGPSGVYARIKMKEVEIERQFDALVRQTVKSKKEGHGGIAAEKPRAASDSASISSRESHASRADRVAQLQQQSDKLFELSRAITVEIDLIKNMGPTTTYKNFSANTGGRSTNLTQNLADLETKKQAVERELYQVGLLLSRQYIKMREEGASEYWVRSVSK